MLGPSENVSISRLLTTGEFESRKRNSLLTSFWKSIRNSVGRNQRASGYRPNKAAGLPASIEARTMSQRSLDGEKQKGPLLAQAVDRYIKEIGRPNLRKQLKGRRAPSSRAGPNAGERLFCPRRRRIASKLRIARLRPFLSVFVCQSVSDSGSSTNSFFADHPGGFARNSDRVR